ncbi:hypothetical protein JVT61DRAFT_14427 [Boletus reticuloceps]|uniref:CxC2-like cysteine cluster KDZ transposase-associated domain-containing protein n=1 Tax=Boletus reticuloceps TaxID=495285 RepID=A0A8I2YVZ9_9AGAM|nr:hypothetical protein JVT61DRAFT_14427 [Boletus reticuloceps]
MSALVAVYLDYQSRDTGDGLPPVDDNEPVDVDSEDNPTPVSLSDIELVDLFTCRNATLISQPHHIYPNETLIYHGYLGCSPIFPSVAILLRTLAAFQQAHRVCPRFTIQAQCKMLCHLHHALGHDGKDWHLQNSCPACCYCLKDEPQLDIEWLVSIDRNHSLKRWDKSNYGINEREDSRVAQSDFWIAPEEVDRFRCEAKARTDEADDWETEETSNTQFNCVNRWRNAGPEFRKKVLSVFCETGIFIASCQHHFVLLICDMIKSGKLAKYLLVTINHLLDVYGKNGGCAYDIGCATDVTLANSLLGPKAHALNLRLMVGAFHGHAHNWKCQLDWHPMYIQGTGHTEGEGCEHVFSASNDLARGTRHASRFHRHQAIEEHFGFWNEDKYNALKECAYFDSLKQPRVKDQLQICYVEALDELEERKLEWNAAHEAANYSLTSVAIGDLVTISKALTQARVRLDTTYSMLQNAQALAGQLQVQIGLEQPWKVGGEEYSQFKQDVLMGKYYHALDELERLVVM